MTAGTKLIALAVVAVMLPTTVISYIQYRSLLEVEHQTKMAAQENLRQAAIGVSMKTAEYLREIGLRIVGDIRYDRSADRREQLESLEQRFAEALRSNPALERIFLFLDCACNQSASGGIVQSRTAARIVVEATNTDPDVKHFAHLREKAMMLTSQQPASQRRFSFTNVPGCEHSNVQTYAFYPLLDTAGQEFGFAGVQFNSTYLLKEFFPKVMPGFADANLALSIRTDTDEIIYADKDQKNYQLQTAFGPVFPQWQLGLDFRNASIEEVAAQNFRQSMMLSVFVLALMIAGITLTLRATAREMRLAEAKSSFVSNVSHELKTPLALIRLFAETLELGRVKTPEKAQEYYRIINSESSRLTQLINNILDFSKIEARRKEYVFEAADAGRIVQEVIRTYEYPIVNEGFDVRTSIESALPGVRVDRAALSQAVLNLLNNAVKYSDSIKEIDIVVRTEGQGVAIEVRDKGIGIPASERHRIFDKFYRISNGMVHDRKGTGLGLALVKHIVEAHNGSIRVDSTPGKGSCFTILLPSAYEQRTESPLLAYEGPDCRR